MRAAEATALLTTRRRLVADGFSDGMLLERVRGGQWQSLGKGVYRLAGEPLQWQHYAVGAQLAYGPDAAVGGQVAAYSHRLLNDPPTVVPVWLPSTHTPARSGLWWPRSDGLGRCGRAYVVIDEPRSGGPIRLVSPEDAIFDHLATLEDEDAVVGFLSGALSGHSTTAAALAYWLQQRPRVAHRPLLADMLDGARGAGSALEYRYRRDCERPHCLPVGELQAAIRPGAVHDVGYRAYRTLVELDGARYHGGQTRFRDMTRDNISLEQGFVTLRYGWSDVVGAPCKVAQQVATILRQRGWSGNIRRCPRCAAAKAHA